MKLRHRFSIIAVGFVLFLLSAPLLVLFARGFKYDFTQNKIVKTGTLVVESEPDNADVYLNDKKDDTQTPANIRFVLPGEYNVTVSKDGYQSWTKRLTIKSQLVTWANDNRDFISLFLTLPDLKETWKTNTATFSSEHKEIAFTDEEQRLIFLDVESGKSSTFQNEPLVGPTFTKSNFVWSNGSKNYEALNSVSLNLPQVFAQAMDAEKIWSDGGRLVFQDGMGLYAIKNNSVKLIDNSVSCAVLASDGIWFIQSLSLKHYDFSSESATTITELLPMSGECQIVRSKTQVYTILGDSLYVVNDSVEKIYSPVRFANYDSGSDQLIYGNDNEILTFSSNRHESELILRSITPIYDPVINDKTGYVFYANENKIKAIELDPRDHRNIYSLITTPQDYRSFTITNDGKLIFVLGDTSVQKYKIR